MAGQALVGRAHELRVVDDALARLASGDGSLLLIRGEPGVGKTALAEEIVDRGRARGARSAWATGWQHAGAPPLWPWRQILRALDAPALLDDTAVDLVADEADAARFQQFEAVTDALSDLARAQPLVVVLDDLQWADAATLRLLAFAAGTLRNRPVLVVGTVRPDEMPPDELAGLLRLGVVVPLTGLEPDAVQDLMMTTLGPRAAAGASATVAERSRGNPLFVREFAQLMAATGRTWVPEQAIPPAVAAVIERRLARQPAQVVKVLEVAAALGRRFTRAELVGLARAETGGEGDPTLEVDAALAAGILEDDGDDLRFAHDLVLDVVSASTPAPRRAALHLHAADALRPRAARDRSLSARVATHLDAAGRVGEAGVFWEEAAAWALSMLAYEEAAACFGRARRALGEDDPTTAERTMDLLLAEADAVLRYGDLAGARALFGTAAAKALSAADAARASAAVLGMGAGVAGWEVPLSDIDYQRMVESVLALVPDDDRRARAALLARLSVAQASPETWESSQRLAQEALELARELDDPLLEANALAALCDAISGPDHAERRYQLAECIVELGRRAGDRGTELLGNRFRVVAALELGRFDDADLAITAFEMHAASLRQPLLGWYVPLFRGMRALLHGRIAEAEHWQRQVAAAHERTGSINALFLASTLMIGIDSFSGRPSPLSMFESALDIDPAAAPSYASGLGLVMLGHGDIEGAAALLHLHADNGFALVRRDSEYLGTLMGFGQIAVAAGELAIAETIHDLLAPYPDLWFVDGIGAVCWGPVKLELGRLAAALGRPDASSQLRAARALAQAAGAPLIVERADALLRTTAVVAPLTAATAAEGVWAREGELWQVSYAGRTVRFGDAKGLGDLAVLLARPGQEVHVLDLWSSNGERPVEGDLGEVLDSQARRSYRDRLEDLEAAIDEATLVGDRGRLEQAQLEREFLLAELSAAVGLGGRGRRAGDPAERARKAVTMRIRYAIRRIEEAHPELAAHLQNSVRTGTFCAYRPERPVAWRHT